MMVGVTKIRSSRGVSPSWRERERERALAVADRIIAPILSQELRLRVMRQGGEEKVEDEEDHTQDLSQTDPRPMER